MPACGSHGDKDRVVRQCVPQSVCSRRRDLDICGSCLLISADALTFLRVLHLAAGSKDLQHQPPPALGDLPWALVLPILPAHLLVSSRDLTHPLLALFLE